MGGTKGPLAGGEEGRAELTAGKLLTVKVGEGKGSGVSLGVKGGRRRRGSSRWCWLTAWCVDTQVSAGQGCLLQRW